MEAVRKEVHDLKAAKAPTAVAPTSTASNHDETPQPIAPGGGTLQAVYTYAQPTVEASTEELAITKLGYDTDRLESFATVKDIIQITAGFTAALAGPGPGAQAQGPALTLRSGVGGSGEARSIIRRRLWLSSVFEHYSTKLV